MASLWETGTIQSGLDNRLSILGQCFECNIGMYTIVSQDCPYMNCDKSLLEACSRPHSNINDWHRNLQLETNNH